MNKIRLFLSVMASLWLLIPLHAKESTLQKVMKEPAHCLTNYKFDIRSSLMQRVQDAPDFAIQYLRNMDGRTDYRPYRLLVSERLMLSNYLELLPSYFVDTFKNDLVGIYFIDNFMGSGLADYIVDADGNMKTVLFINPATMKNDISKWLTYKENTCFIKDPATSVDVWCGTNYTGLLYILLHEGTHVVDYMRRLTPYVEKTTREILGQKSKATPFTAKIWKDYRLPVKKYDYPLRNKADFYGFGGGPHFSVTNALRMYQALGKTPFASIYGSMSWAEDMAELAAFYHMTVKLGLPYEIRLRKKEVVVQVFEFKPWMFFRQKEISRLYE